jgi:tetratricopeptide (TPR) repeat protein
VLSPEEEKRRRDLENTIDLAKAQIAENVWHNPGGSTFSDYYKVLARAFARGGTAEVEGVVRDAMRRREESLPADKSIAEALAIAKQHLDARRNEQAKAVYQHILMRDPDNAEALSHLGIVAACLGRPRDGLQMMARAVQLQPRVPLFHYNLGELLRLTGRFAEAEGAFRASLRLNPNDAGILSLLGLTLAQQGKAAEGLELCRRAVASGSQPALVHFRMGLVLAQQRRYAEARASYEASLAADPGFVHARRALEELPATGPAAPPTNLPT